MAAVWLLSSSVARASNERSLPCSTVQLVSRECLLRGESGLPASRGNASSPPVSYRSSYARFPPEAEVPSPVLAALDASRHRHDGRKIDVPRAAQGLIARGGYGDRQAS